jgi:tripartite ATP-independent transporter DctP family solute receptor
VRRATSSLAKERGADSGWITDKLALLMPLTPRNGQSSYDMTSASMTSPPRSTGPGTPARNDDRLRRMTMNRRTVLRLGAASALGALATDLGVPAFAQQKLVLKATDVHPLGYPTVEAVVAMGKKLDAATGGRLTIQMYPSMQLGGEKEMIEQAQVGALAIARVSVGPMGPLVPELNVFNLPFMFRDDAHMEKVIDGPIGDELLKKLSEHPTAGLIGLCWMNAGTRNVYNSKKPIKSIDDLKGLKIRMMGNPVFVDTMNALGGNGVAMGFDQLVNAMQTGVVDGAENNYPSYATGQHYRYAKYYSLTGHLMIPEVLVFSKKIWDTLGKDDQALILKLAREAQQDERTLWYAMEEKSRSEMEKAGVQITNIDDKKPFQDAVQPVWEKYGKQHADLIKRIQDVK